MPLKKVLAYRIMKDSKTPIVIWDIPAWLIKNNKRLKCIKKNNIKEVKLLNFYKKYARIVKTK